ncbi:CPXCG motif-containing cysteine-rich protein [Pseudidiomarina sp. PP-1MA]|uniref:CPXCG motif-containing cysteine-rich protein n=1 Tax=Pseudidiomarina sp. PP-1MA TaxID=3237706 RepID=A0AB39XEA6_9GAMM
MNADKLYDAGLRCPHCGHRIHVSIDPSEGAQDYLDECAACGSDIHLIVKIDEVADKIFVRVASDDENFY